jgi:hypothetical protein
MEPNSTADRYVNGHGMSFGLEDQKPQPQSPPSSLLGLFFPAGSNFAAIIIRFKMETPTKRDKYTAKRISEITDRIAALRVRWLHHVETQLASQQSRPVLEHYKLSTEAAE